jgi:hypothetical protein
MEPTIVAQWGNWRVVSLRGHYIPERWGRVDYFRLEHRWKTESGRWSEWRSVRKLDQDGLQQFLEDITDHLEPKLDKRSGEQEEKK